MPPSTAQRGQRNLKNDIVGGVPPAAAGSNSSLKNTTPLNFSKPLQYLTQANSKKSLLNTS